MVLSFGIRTSAFQEMPAPPAEIPLAAPRVDAIQLGTPGGGEDGDVTNSGKVKRRFSAHPS